MIKGNNCCYQCKDRFVKKQEDGRTISCHSTCDKYIAYRKELDEFNADMLKQKQVKNDIMSGIFDGINKSKKRKHNRWR